jgi:hypothetical protein
LPIDFTFYLWAGSLCLSLAAAVLFLWLMREPRDNEGRKTDEGRNDHGPAAGGAGGGLATGAAKVSNRE